MKFSKILTTILTCAPALIKAASQDYARHLELSILFYEGIYIYFFFSFYFLFVFF